VQRSHRLNIFGSILNSGLLQDMSAKIPFHGSGLFERFANHHRGIATALGCLVLVQIASATGLSHRFTFTTNANNVLTNAWAPNAHGSVWGGAVFDGTGGLVLDGINDYVQLPGNLISGLSEITIEAWVTWHGGTSPYWQRVFDFGNSVNPDYLRGAYLFLTPATAFTDHAPQNRMRATATTNGILGESPWLDWGLPMPTDVETHVALTYSPGLGVTRLYANGAAVAVGAATIPLNRINDSINYLGRSRFGDSYFKGRFNEFRIYRSFLLDSEIEASYLAGPDTPAVSTGTQIGTTLAVGVTGDTATLNALVQPNGLATMVFFEYGPTTNYGIITEMWDAGSDTNVVAISSPIFNLTAGTIYHFRCVATNAVGTMYGGNSRFMTQPLITSVALTNGGVQVQFGASAGMRYFLRQSTNLPPVNWSSVTNRLMTADGPYGFTDWTATNHSMRFYQLRVRDW
jgi:hypothetical protein